MYKKETGKDPYIIEDDVGQCSGRLRLTQEFLAWVKSKPEFKHDENK
jgi:hypothetical protein